MSTSGSPPISSMVASPLHISLRSLGQEARNGSPVAQAATIPTPLSFGSVLTPPAATANSKEALYRASRRAAPSPPEQHVDTPSDRNDEAVVTPLYEQLSRKFSACRHGPMRPEDDPEVRRDFEARIAAATAALNRTPSVGLGSRLERKPSRRGPMVISTPTLMSSSAKLPPTPLTPPEHAITQAMARALEKTTGSTSKVSARWRTLAFRKGSSVSGEILRPTASPKIASLSAAANKNELKAPIALRTAESDSPDLNAFRFPPNSADANKQMHSATAILPSTSDPGLEQIRGRMRRERSDETAENSGKSVRWPSVPHHVETARGIPYPQPAANFDLSALLPEGPHSPTSSDQSTVAKFVEAGRALGMNDEQLNEMLAHKGMLNRSTTSTSSKSYVSTAPTSSSVSQASPTPGSTGVEWMPSTDKNRRGLFRVLSRGKKHASPAATTPNQDENVARKVVVRRTLLIPSEPVPTMTMPSGRKPSGTPESQNSSASRPGQPTRKLSIKRKPINLTPEDHQLVSGSPPAHKRNHSTGTVGSGRSDTAEESTALGFLHPNPQLGRSTSSAHSMAPSDPGSTGGGSFYDLYRDDEGGGLEILQSPSSEKEKRTSAQTTGSTHAVEIW